MWFAAYILLLSVSFSSAASETWGTVTIDSRTEQVELAPYVTVLEDEQGTLKFSDVIDADSHGEFQPLINSRFSKGYESSAYWLKIQFERREGEQLNDPFFWLEIANPQLSHVDFYRKTVDGLHVVSTGADLPFTSRPIKHRNFIFPLDFSNITEQTIYFRIDTVSLLDVPLRLWSRDEFLSSDSLLTGLNFGYLSIILLMACYNFFLYLRIKDRSYLMYVIYALSFGMFVVSLLGYGRQYVWPTVEGLDGNAVPFFCLLLAVTCGQFTRSYLQTKIYLPRYDRMIQLLSIGAIVPMLLHVVGLSIMRPLSVVAVILVSTMILLIAFKRYRQGSRLAGFYIFGWGSLIGTSFIYMASAIFGVIDMALSIYAVLCGSIIEMVVFSLGLADRINSERMAKHKALALQGIAAENLEKANSKLHSQAKELEIALHSSDQHNRLKGEFLCSVSHELRTPINGIVGYLELLDTRNLNKDQKEAITAIDLSSSELLELVDSILNFNEDLQVLHEEPINIGDIIAHSIQLLLPRARSTLWTIDSDSTSYPRWMMGDKERLTQLIFNILSNALKYGDRVVEIGLFFKGHGENSNLVMEVWNDGPQIPEDRQDSIFEPFTQGVGGYGRLNGGLGIGLALCKKMVELMNGSIGFDSREGHGTRFRVDIPLKACSTSRTGEVCTLQEHSLMRMLDAKQFRLEEHLQSQPPRGDEPMSAESPEVLIVEDNLVNRKILSKMLTSLGYTVTEACDGREGFLTASKKQYDAILMDCQMPYMDGFITTENIRKLSHWGHSVPIIAITANVLEVDRKRCLLAGMNDYLSKPAKLDEIEECLSRWVYSQ